MKLFINDILFVDVYSNEKMMEIEFPLLELNKRNNYSFIQNYFYYLNGSDIDLIYERNIDHNVIRKYQFSLKSSYTAYTQFVKYLKSKLQEYEDSIFRNNHYDGYFIPVEQNKESSSRFYYILNELQFKVINVIKTDNDYDVFKMIYNIESFSQSIVVKSFDKEYSTYLLSNTTLQKAGCNEDYTEYNYDDKIICEKLKKYISSNIYEVSFTLNMKIEDGKVKLESEVIPFQLTEMKYNNIISNGVLYELKLKSNQLLSHTYGKYQVSETNEIYSGITPGYYYKIITNERYLDIEVENITQFKNSQDSTYLIGSTTIDKCFTISFDDNNVYCVDKYESDNHYWLESLILNEFMKFPKISYSVITKNISNIIEYYQSKSFKEFYRMNRVIANQCSHSNNRLLYSLLEKGEEREEEEKLVKNTQFIGRGDMAMKRIYRGFFITESNFIYIYKNYTHSIDEIPEIKYVYSYTTIFHDNKNIKQSQLYDIENDKVYSFEEYSSKSSIDDSIYDQVEITFTSINETHFQMIDNLTDNIDIVGCNIIFVRDNYNSIIYYSNVMFHLKDVQDEKSLVYFNSNSENIYKIYDKFYSILSQKDENSNKLRIEVDMKNDNYLFLSITEDEYIYSTTEYFERMDSITKYSYSSSNYVLNEVNETFLYSLSDVESYIQSIKLVEKPSEYSSNQTKNNKLPVWMIVVIVISSAIFILLIILLIYGMYRNKKKVIIKIKRKRLSSYEEKKKQNVDDNVILLNQNKKKKKNEKVNQPENDPFIPPPPHIEVEEDDDKLPPSKPKNAWN